MYIDVVACRNFVTTLNGEVQYCIVQSARKNIILPNIKHTIVGDSNIIHVSKSRPFWNKYFIHSIEHSTCICTKTTFGDDL